MTNELSNTLIMFNMDGNSYIFLVLFEITAKTNKIPYMAAAL